MINKKLNVKTLFLVFISMAIFDVNAKTVGMLTIDKDTQEEVNHNGSANFVNSKFTKQVRVNGSLTAKNVQFEDALDVNGRLTLTQARGTKDVHILGIAKFSQSEFKSNLLIRGDHGSVLTDVNVSGIVDFTGNDFEVTGTSNITKILVHPSIEHPGNPVVKLSNGVHLTQNIEFEGMQGKVVIDPKSEYTGKIINGTLEAYSLK